MYIYIYILKLVHFISYRWGFGVYHFTSLLKYHKVPWSFNFVHLQPSIKMSLLRKSTATKVAEEEQHVQIIVISKLRFKLVIHVAVFQLPGKLLEEHLEHPLAVVEVAVHVEHVLLHSAFLHQQEDCPLCPGSLFRLEAVNIRPFIRRVWKLLIDLMLSHSVLTEVVPAIMAELIHNEEASDVV